MHLKSEGCHTRTSNSSNRAKNNIAASLAGCQETRRDRHERDRHERDRNERDRNERDRNERDRVAASGKPKPAPAGDSIPG
jgi:hypothetical protein